MARGRNANLSFTRTFDGTPFRFLKVRRTKLEAQKVADHYRRNHSARVVKCSGGYAVYIRACPVPKVDYRR